MLKRIIVLSPSLVITYIFVIVAALDKIACAFPDVPKSAVQLLSALPSLLAIPVILISGSLCSRFSKKLIIIASLLLMTIGGLFPLAFHSEFWMLMAGAVVIGVGYGGLSSLTSALIVEHFDGKEQTALLSCQGTVIGVGGMLFSLLAGRLILGEWWHIYFAYLLLIPILVLSLFLPRGELTAPNCKNYGSLLNKKMTLVLLQGVLFNIFFFTFQSNIAMLIAQLSIGSERLASNALFIHSIMGILSGFIGGRLLEKYQQRSLAVFMMIAGVGILSVFLLPSTAAIYLSAIAVGFTHSLRMSAGYLKAKSAAAPDAATAAISAYCAICQAGQFFSPIVVNWICSGLGFAIEKRFLLAGAGMILLSFISLLLENQAEYSRCS